MAREPADHFRGLSAAHAVAVRTSDCKANIVIFLHFIEADPIVGARDKFPPFLPVPAPLAPFLSVFFSLFVAPPPRRPRRGPGTFLVSRRAAPRAFPFVDNSEVEAAQPRPRCAIPSQIPTWKTTRLGIAFPFASLPPFWRRR